MRYCSCGLRALVVLGSFSMGQTSLQVNPERIFRAGFIYSPAS
ncbi:hypothetical protein LptCag_2153 [Leptospirillum ferriphilum]|uniref:Uncharacterized protein n=1 Tax=Leptospirillum ferriphilum TaxID=178606 RepID=A0A094WB08_9BACT|nr:hypothetical protein LptCag_2153 [Leptospirillum ferriphilum]